MERNLAAARDQRHGVALKRKSAVLQQANAMRVAISARTIAQPARRSQGRHAAALEAENAHAVLRAARYAAQREAQRGAARNRRSAVTQPDSVERLISAETIAPHAKRDKCAAAQQTESALAAVADRSAVK